jgi:hypothetical protein
MSGIAHIILRSMPVKGLAILGLAVLPLAASVGRAQSPEADPAGGQAPPVTRADHFTQLRLHKSMMLEPEKVSAPEKSIRWYENRPVYRKLTGKGYNGVALKIGGLPSGSGFATGLNYHRGRESGRAHLEATALISTKMFKRGQIELAIPGPEEDPPLQLNINAEYQDYTDRRFYGLGPNSNVHRETFFGDENRRLGASVDHDSKWVAFSAGATVLNGTNRAGRSDPSTDTVFGTDRVPGVGVHSEWIVPAGEIQLRLLDRGYPPLGATLGFGLQHYADQRGTDLSFSRWTAEVIGYVPLGPRSRRLALRARTSQSLPDAGSEVPYQLMETIGGARSVRGFLEYRFRDVRNLVMSAEYRWEIWTFADWVFFADAGKVFSDPNDLSLSNLETSYGTGLRVHAPGDFDVVAQFAKSKETYAIHLGSGPRF